MVSIEAGVDGADLVALLVAAFTAFVTTDLIHRLVPYAARLRVLDYAEHPRARGRRHLPGAAGQRPERAPSGSRFRGGY